MEQIIQKKLQKGEFRKVLNLLEIYKEKGSNNVALNYYFVRKVMAKNAV